MASIPKPPVKSAGVSAAHSDTRKAAVKKAAEKGVSPVKTGVSAKKKVTAKKAAKEPHSDTPAGARARTARVFFSEVTLELIFDRVASGESLKAICALPGMPSRKAVYEWIAEDKDVERRYSVAQMSKVESFLDQTISIADDGSQDTYTDKEGNERTDPEVLGRSKLRVEARLRYAEMIAPAKYGKHSTLAVDLTVKLGDDEMNDRIAALMRKAAGGR